MSTTAEFVRSSRLKEICGEEDPVRIQEALGNMLSGRVPGKSAPPRKDWSGSALLGLRTSAARDFADLVETKLIGPILPWTQRQHLVREANRRNIGRFEANLIIATVQNQRRSVRRTTTEAADRGSWLMPVAAFLLLELAVAMSVWHLFF